MLIPKVALLDPELTISLPAEITATSGMDALTQCVEAYISRKAKPLAAVMALDGARRIAAHLSTAYHHGDDLTARGEVMLGALQSGIALGNSGLGAAHGIAAALGAMYGIPHGLACAILLPEVMDINAPHVGEKITSLAGALTGGAFSGSTDEAAKKVCEKIRQLNAEVQIPQSLDLYEISKEDIPDIAARSGGSSMSGNPVELSGDQVEEILRRLI
jgi:alcohol dehydrogenase